MIEPKVSSRYASSFIETAIQKNTLDVVLADVDLITRVLRENPQLNRVLENPVIKHEVKSSIVKQIFESKVSSETLDFLEFLIKKKRINLVSNILLKFKELTDLKMGYANVNITVASEFTSEQKEALRNKLQALLRKKIRMNFTVDEKIIGGFILKTADTVYNASIKHKLDLLRKYFNEASIIHN